MSNSTNIPDDEILPEYNLKGGVRGKYAAGTNLVRLDADVAAVFPDSDSVNRALRAIAGIIQDHEAKVRRLSHTGRVRIRRRTVLPPGAG
jgi:hypothetical protein